MKNKEKEYIEDYNLIDFIKYNSLFKEKIRARGDKVFKSDSILDYSFENNRATCKISGTDTYELSIKFDKNDNITKMSCTCPYYKKGNNCKHLYALLIKAKLEDNYDKLIGLQSRKLIEYSSLLDRCSDYFEENIIKYSSEDINNINKFLSYYKDYRIPTLNKMISKDSSQEKYLQNVIKVQEEKQDIIDWFNKIKSNEKKVEYYNTNDTSDTNNVRHKKVNKSNHKSNALLYLGSILRGLCDGLSSKSEEEERKRKHENAIRELEKGNPEDYVDLYGYIDDYVIDKQYPIEQEDEDEYD